KVYSAAVVGHSLGGLVALQFALSFPDRCPALVLCSTTPAMPSLTDGELIYHLLPAETRFDGVFSRLWKRLFGYKQPTVDDSDPRSYLIRSMADLDRATLSRRLSILRDTDMTPALGEIAVPTLIVASSGDKPYILASSQLMDERIPDSSLEVIENADQFYFHTRHDLFNALLADYLTEKIARL
ncbi:MAG: alpha/beta hydrolase, partial [Chloroflexi bacterium]|nr:alpha/beta hydrolase [Chloroflexota bacterium]